jgi:diacylglycerol kinase family enzyme
MRGNVIKLMPFNHPRALVEEEIRRGIKNVVVVGNDATFSRLLSSSADLNVTWGFMPLGAKNNNLADILGIPLNEASVEVLAARKIEKVDYGLINGKYFFISYLHVPSSKIKVTFEDSFTIESAKAKQELAVSNLLPSPLERRDTGLHPADGRLEAYVRPEYGGLISSLFKGKSYYEPSIFSFKKMVVTAEKPIKIFADGREMLGKKIVVEIAPGKVKLIVGKNRKF